MQSVAYNEAYKKILDSFLLSMPGVVAGKMFGYPAYYTHKKLFACLYEEGVGIKVPEELAQKLLKRKDIVPFQPLGKAKMREWIQINKEKPKDYLGDKTIFEKSIEFVMELALKNK